MSTLTPLLEMAHATSDRCASTVNTLWETKYYQKFLPYMEFDEFSDDDDEEERKSKLDDRVRARTDIEIALNLINLPSSRGTTKQLVTDYQMMIYRPLNECYTRSLAISIHQHMDAFYKQISGGLKPPNHDPMVFYNMCLDFIDYQITYYMELVFGPPIDVISKRGKIQMSMYINKLTPDHPAVAWCDMSYRYGDPIYRHVVKFFYTFKSMNADLLFDFAKVEAMLDAEYGAMIDNGDMVRALKRAKYVKECKAKIEIEDKPIFDAESLYRKYVLLPDTERAKVIKMLTGADMSASSSSSSPKKRDRMEEDKDDIINID